MLNTRTGKPIPNNEIHYATNTDLIIALSVLAGRTQLYKYQVVTAQRICEELVNRNLVYEEFYEEWSKAIEY